MKIFVCQISFIWKLWNTPFKKVGLANIRIWKIWFDIFSISAETLFFEITISFRCFHKIKEVSTLLLLFSFSIMWELCATDTAVLIIRKWLLFGHPISDIFLSYPFKIIHFGQKLSETPTNLSKVHETNSKNLLHYIFGRYVRIENIPEWAWNYIPNYCMIVS